MMDLDDIKKIIEIMGVSSIYKLESFGINTSIFEMLTKKAAHVIKLSSLLSHCNIIKMGF